MINKGAEVFNTGHYDSSGEEIVVYQLSDGTLTEDGFWYQLQETYAPKAKLDTLIRKAGLLVREEGIVSPDPTFPLHDFVQAILQVDRWLNPAHATPTGHCESLYGMPIQDFEALIEEVVTDRFVQEAVAPILWLCGEAGKEELKKKGGKDVEEMMTRGQHVRMEIDEELFELYAEAFEDDEEDGEAIAESLRMRLLSGAYPLMAGLTIREEFGAVVLLVPVAGMTNAERAALCEQQLHQLFQYFLDSDYVAGYVADNLEWPY